MKPAVFLDRDGVINKLVPNSVTGEFEPPHAQENLILFPEVIASLCNLQDAGFDLFIVSNQPDYAKGKNALEQIWEVHEKLDQIFKNSGIFFRDYYYCYHHPEGIIPGYSLICECRKPKPFFLKKAARDHGIDLDHSWMVGDRDTDIECGKAAGTRTILIRYQHSSEYQGSSNPDFSAANLKDAVRIILQK